jgi:hypothetical protein
MIDYGILQNDRNDLLFFGNKETNRDEMILQNDFLGLSFTLRGV